MPATLSVVCLLLAQTGSGVEFEPPAKPSTARSKQVERGGEFKAPALKLGEPSFGKPKPPNFKSAEPKTLIQPSSRRPPPLKIESDEPEAGDSKDFEVPPAAPPFAPRPSRGAPLTLDDTDSPAAPVSSKPRSVPFAPRVAAPAAAAEAGDEPEFPLPPSTARRTSQAPAFRASDAQTGTLPSAIKEPLAVLLMKRGLHVPEPEQLPGQSETLLATLAKSSDRATQLKVVKAYWLLSVGLLEYDFAVQELAFLESVHASQASHEQSLVAAAKAAAAAHLRQARLAASATQQDLADAAQTDANAPLPLPSDLPYVGGYRTSFKELFANRTAPTSLRRIDRTLPALRELIEAQAAAVMAAEESLGALAHANQRGEASLAAVIEAHTNLRRQRREFLVAVRDYNFSIADYALAVVNPTATRGMLVATLIETVPDAKSVLVSSKGGVQPASASEPIVADEEPKLQFSPGGKPPTFRQPTKADLVPVAPPTLNPSEFVPLSR